MHPNDWFSINCTQWISSYPCWLAEGYWKLVGTCAGLRVCWFICVLPDHIPHLFTSRHVRITCESSAWTASISADVDSGCGAELHHHVLTGDGADNPWEIKLLVMRSATWLGSGLQVFTWGSDARFCQHIRRIKVYASRLKCASSTVWREIVFDFRMRWNFNGPAGKLGGCSGSIV